MDRRISRVDVDGAPAGVNVYRVDCLDGGGDADRFIDRLDEAERVYALRIVDRGDRARYVLRRAARRLLLERHAAELTFSALGRPGFSTPSADDFSSASSGDLALIAFARGLRIGIDVERIRELDNVRELAAAALDTGEMADFDAAGPRGESESFLRFWTMKEAVLKAAGTGVAVPAAAMRRPDPANAWNVVSFFPGPGYVGALASGPAAASAAF